MNLRRLLPALLLTFALAAAAGATDLTGTVTNKTTGKPAAGAEVILLKLAEGMDEAGRTKVDARGRYKIALDNDATPHLVRVVFQDVTYHKQAAPGTTTADVDVYDAAPKVAGVRTSMNIVRLEPQSGQVNVMELYAVKNESSPPRTQMSDRTFEVTLPAGAQIDTALIASPGGLPINGSPIPGKKPGEFGFMFPLRPGETRFQIAYHLPYSGSADWKPKVTGTLEHFVVMVPKDVQLTPADPSLFQAMPDEQGANVRVATNVDPAKNVAFKISGTGTFPPDTQNPQSPGPVGGEAMAGGGAQAQAQGGAERPGGGLGAPINSPNPLQQYMWWILGGFVALLAGGAYFFYRQPEIADEEEAPVALKQTRVVAARAAQPTAPAARAAGNGRSGLVLDALKEEMFQLETERASGKISAEEYRKHKEALDLTLQRALARQKN
jgi:5-hydroxyisourate hydrolase-like protein (transthyretin family)